IIKRIFIWIYFCILPWFLEKYSGHKNRKLLWSINVLFFIAYPIMVMTRTDSMKPVWLILCLIPFGLIGTYGWMAAIKLLRSGEKKKGTWLSSAMAIYGVLYLLAVINQLGNNYFGRLLGTKLFFPFTLHVLALLVIMNIRLRVQVYEKYRLEKLLSWQDTRWNLLVRDMHLMVVELDRKGSIRYVNAFAAETMGCSTETDWLNKNWFDVFLPPEKTASRKSVYLKMIQTENLPPHLTGEIITKDGRHRVVKWMIMFIHDEHKKVTGTLNIGMDITETERAFEEVKTLRDELAKEQFQYKDEVIASGLPYNIIGRNEAIMYAIQRAQQVAPTGASVLIEGETGTGKELFANLIHNNSYRSTKPFIKVNCASLPPELIESELFGHEKGAFTGALQLRKGRFELANGGTIFLDEIGELPLSLQPKLLRVLQTGEFQRIGGQQTIKVDVRIISATNRNLRQEVSNRRFREDLYYRLNVFMITIPSLRSRREDIPLLVSFYVDKLSLEHHKTIENISRADMQHLSEYRWPGNVRELINLLERSIISNEGPTLKLEWQLDNTSQDLEPVSSDATITELEKTHILKVLTACNWKINGSDGAAAKLGLNPNTLRSRLKKLNIVRHNI
ncbi:MAG TPA: sigma 54-interacting transcriptional regulator, partial [Puia sp.]|nr:sigma 54-interacting transcriptional regulator [Puia sp.]